jgi:hypothetical protein
MTIQVFLLSKNHKKSHKSQVVLQLPKHHIFKRGIIRIAFNFHAFSAQFVVIQGQGTLCWAMPPENFFASL